MMGISLYTSRVVLQMLGIEDYGVYNVVGGIVATLSILSGTLSGAISRFITFELGQGHLTKVQSIVSTALSIQIIISVLVVAVAETLGLWFLMNCMNIPPHRGIAAIWVFQFAVITFVIRLLTVPYNALIISHEKMGIYAYFSIIEVILQLGVVFLLKIIATNKLEIYSGLMMATVLSSFLMFSFYCKRNFDECTFRPLIDKTNFRAMAGFAGWNFIGTSSGVFRNQGIDIIVNIFTNVTINAARGVATQVNTAIMRFVQGFMTALQPQIIKSYAAQDKDRFYFLIIQGTRFSFYLMLFLSLPVLFEMETILGIWLKEVPEFASIFTRFQIIDSLIITLSYTLIIGLLATGKIKRYQIIVGLLSLCNFPLSFFFLYIGLPVYTTYLVAIGIEIFCFASRLCLANELTGLNIGAFIRIVVINISRVTCVAIVIPTLLYLFMEPGLWRFFTITVSCFVMTSVSILFFGLSNNERIQFYLKIKSLLSPKKVVV